VKLSILHAGSLSSSGSEFQTIWPATGKARRPYVLSRQEGTMSRCWLAERSRCRDATSMAGLMCSARYRGACPCRQRYVMRPSLKVTLSGTFRQCSLSCRNVDRPRSNFLVSLTTRAAALSSLLVAAYYRVYTIKHTSSNHQANIQQMHLKYTGTTCALIAQCLLDDCLLV